MSLTDTIKRLVAAGASAEIIAIAVEAIEQAATQTGVRTRTAGAERQARYIERKRQQASVSVTSDVSDDATSVTDSLSLPSSPQTPQLPTHTHGDINTHARKADREPEGFEAFWEVYPRRIGKDAARKAFAKAIRRTSLPTLITAVRRDAESQWRDRPPDMIPHPSTWLNQARWEDEPPPEDNTIRLRPTHERHHENPGLERSSSNLERAFAGAEVAARLRTVQSSGGF